MSLGNRVLKSSALVIVASWIKRSIGIISMIILARLLVPDDYGLVAIASLVLRFFEVFSETGFAQYILSRKNMTEDELYTAWTLKFISRVILTVTVFSLAYPIAYFYEQPELAPVMMVIALVPLINGLESPGMFFLFRNLHYGKFALVTIITKLTAFVATITVAWLYQSYWALVIGDIVLAATFTFCTYRLHEARPKWSLIGAKNQWRFSKWVLLRGILGYSRAKFDSFVISKFYGLSELGVYTLSKELATIPHNQVTTPMIGILLSGMSRNSDDPVKSADTFSKLFVCLVAVVFPVATGIYLLADLLIPIALGDNWSSAIPVIQGLAMLSLTYSMTTVVASSMTAMKKVKPVFYLDLVTFLLVAPSLWMISSMPIAEFAYMRTAIGLGIFIVFFGYLTTVLPVQFRKLLMSLVPILISGSIMFICIIEVRVALYDILPFLQLLILFLIGAFSYTVSLSILVFCMSGLSNELSFIKTQLVMIQSKILQLVKARLGHVQK